MPPGRGKDERGIGCIFGIHGDRDARSQRGELGVLQGKDQAKIGDSRWQREIDLDLGSSGPLSSHGKEPDGQHGPETSLPALEVLGRIELVGQLRVRNFDLDDCARGGPSSGH